MSEKLKFKAFTIDELKELKNWPFKSFPPSTPTTPVQENVKPVEVETPSAPTKSPGARKPALTIEQLTAGKKWAHAYPSNTESNDEQAFGANAIASGPQAASAVVDVATKSATDMSEDVAVNGSFEIPRPNHSDDGPAARTNGALTEPVSPKYGKKDLEQLRENAIDPIEDLKAKVDTLMTVGKKTPPSAKTCQFQGDAPSSEQVLQALQMITNATSPGASGATEAATAREQTALVKTYQFTKKAYGIWKD